MRWKRSLITNASACNNWQGIQKNCLEFTRYCGFDHFFILGSFFDDYINPRTQALSNYCDTDKLRHSANIYTILAEIIEKGMTSGTPLIRGKLNVNKPHGGKILGSIKHISKHDNHCSINFPVHFPAGRFALLHIGTVSKQPINYDSVLTEGYQFALAICSSLFNLIESPFTNKKLTEREHSCLTLVTDGVTPRMASSQLGLSVHTVQYYLKMARQKLHGKNLQQAISHAINQGQISLETELAAGLATTHIRNL